MSSEQTPTTMVKGSNIGFVLGILFIVGLGMYLFKSGFMAEKFGISQDTQATPTPSPTKVPLIEIEDEPITLLEDDTPVELPPVIVNQATKSAKNHKPVDTALGDNPLIIVLFFLGGALIAGKLSKQFQLGSK